MDSNLDRRESKRLRHEAVIWHDNLLPDIYYAAKMCNLSKDGIYIESDQIIYPGEEIYLTLKNPASPANANREQIHVVIKWRKELQNTSYRYGYGAKFVNPIETLFKSFDKDKFRKQSTRDNAFKYRKDPRAYPRKAYRKLTLFSSKNKNYKGLITNISRGGAFIITKNKLSLGQMIHIVIPGGKKNMDVKLEGWVVRLHPKGFGVKFDRRTGRDRRRVLDPRGRRNTKAKKHILYD